MATTEKAEKREIKVDPIRSLKDIKKIAESLSKNPRDLALFVVGINTNFRASDLLKIKVGDVRNLKVGEHFATREQKTSKERFTTINAEAYEVIQALLATMPNAQDDEPLFQSRRDSAVTGKRLAVSTFSVMVKGWCDTNIKGNGNYGSHSLRKTFGYIQRIQGADIPTLMTVFNHSTQRQTLMYLGIQADDVKDLYMKGIKYK